MVPLMDQMSVRLIKDTTELIKKTRYVNTFQLFTQYSFEVMMATSFGSYEKPSAEDLEMTMRYTPNVFAMVLAVVCPALAKISGMRIFAKTPEDYLIAKIRKSLNDRRKSSSRHDFVDLIDLFLNALHANKEVVAKMSNEEKDTFIVSQALMMLLVGFRNTSTTLALAFYYLAIKPEIQEKLFNEISEVLNDKNEDEEFDYDDLK